MTSLTLGNSENILSCIKLIDGEDAIVEFSKMDNFLKNMSEFDLQSRLKTSEKVSMEDYIKFITQQILPWNSKYVKIITDIIDNLNKSLDILKLVRLPEEILVLLTNGNDEAGAAYCRNMNMIVLPITKIQNVDSGIASLANGNEWQTTFPHELFHIVSRNNCELRDRLYKCIGYYPIPENNIAKLPNGQTHLKITNPDAPITKHYIELCTKNSNEKLRLAPVLVASKKYNPDENKNFFDYLETYFAVLDERWNTSDLIQYSDVIGFYDKIGNNTDYIIHPEEILADNFVLLLTHNFDVPSPNILRMMMNALR